MKVNKIESIIIHEIEKIETIGYEPFSVYISGKNLPVRIETDYFEAIRHPHDKGGANYLIQLKNYAGRNPNETY